MSDQSASLQFEDVPRFSTCLEAMVRAAKHHGFTLNRDQLMRSHPFDTDEPSPALLIAIADRAGLRAQMIRIKPGRLSTLARSLPAILLSRTGRAALITGIKSSARGNFAVVEELETRHGVSVLYDEPRLFEFWPGDVVVLKRNRRVSAEEPFGFMFLLQELFKQRVALRDIAIAACFMSLLALFPPMAFMIMLDRVLVNYSFATLEVLGMVLAGLVVFETTFGFVRRHLIWITTSRIDARLNLYIFDKLIDLPISFFERTPTGMINAKIAQIWHVRSFLKGELLGTLLDSVTLVVLVPVLFYLNWKLSILVLFLAFSILTIYLLFLPSLRRRHARLIAAEQSMASHQVETIYGIRTVKSLSLEGLRRQQRDEKVAELTEAHQAYEALANYPQTIANPFERLIYAGSFFLGCFMAITDSGGSGGTMGSIVAFSLIASRVAAPIVQLASVMNAFEHARGAMAEVASVVNEPPEQGRSGNRLKLPIRGAISFQNVRFRYSPTASYALDGVSFDIGEGQIIGVMGRSGSGKTTVARLLQGLNRDYEGAIKIDGMDLREIDLDHLRANIGVVPQENFLFSGTIRDNIGAARPRAGFDRIMRAAQLVGAEEFIERLPNGYETVIEEGAVNLSGGQRQRIAIARALMVDPPILILDEATSALDAESEAVVNANLRRIARNRTVIIISHRLASLLMADAIIVLERGRLYDMGNHFELMSRCDIYQSLWSQQNRHLEKDARESDGELQPA